MVAVLPPTVRPASRVAGQSRGVTQERRRWRMSGGWRKLSTRRDGRGSGPDGTGPVSKPASTTVRRWIWFRSEPGGRRVALEEFEALAIHGQAGLAKVMQRYRDGQSRRQDVDSMGDGIFELRYRRGTERFRLLFMPWGPHLVALTAFQKKQPKTPKPDLDRARTRAKRWRHAFGAEPASGLS
jgi:phage-related protein